MNYDFSLDMETDNSNSVILRNIKPGSKVLEFGCAHGRMTKYLGETLKCDISIVEIDDKAASSDVIGEYTSCALVGEEKGDIEGEFWGSFLPDGEFDHIIFADVLEHLKDPLKALKTASSKLKEDGSIFISIPNIGHNSVVIDLLNHKFDYRDTGILDKTHLKFFSYSSLKKFVLEAGLGPVKEFNLINVVNNTEFNNSYKDVPEVISEYLKSRDMGEVYQFVWELKKHKPLLSIAIPLFNKWLFTKSALEDLSKFDSTKLEIIVVDNASSDNTANGLKEFANKMPNLKILTLANNIGFGRACNMAYQQAKSDYVMFLNNDIRIKDKSFDWMHDIIAQCDDETLVGPTGGKIDLNKGCAFLYETNDANKDKNYLSGWCIVGKKTVWDKLGSSNKKYLGPFCEDYFCYFEDTHLSFEATSKNIKLKMMPVPMVHFGQTSSKQLNTAKLYTDSKNIFMNKWC